MRKSCHACTVLSHIKPLHNKMIVVIVVPIIFGKSLIFSLLQLVINSLYRKIANEKSLQISLRFSVSG